MTAADGTLDIREPVASDIAWMTALNNAAVPAVNTLSEEAMAALLDACCFARVMSRDGEGLALLIGFDQTGIYDSLNFQWFKARYEGFLYVDRIVVDDRTRGEGLGAKLYHAYFAEAEARGLPVTCEVNERPPNPGSMRFHERAGFKVVGRQDTEGGAKSVALLMRDS